jgi:hypothetical protein
MTGPSRPQYPSYFPPPPEPSQATRRKGKKWPWIVGVPFGVFVLLLIIGIIVGPSKVPNLAATNNAASLSNTPSAAPVAPLPSSAQPAPASPPAPAPAVIPTVASQADRGAAASILTVAGAHYRNVFTQGRVIAGTTQYAGGMAGLSAMEDPNSAAARFRDWRQSTRIEQDVSSYIEAFKQADAHFTADNEPQAIGSWQDDIAAAQADISRWVSIATSYQIGQKTLGDLDQAAAKVNADFAKVDKDVSAVRGVN